MEKEGLVRAVNKLQQESFKVDTLVTDRHSQISKWVEENLSETNHCNDIWHIAKGKTKLSVHDKLSV